MTIPWTTRTVQADDNNKKIITEPGFGFQMGPTAVDGVRVRLLSRDQGVGENVIGSRSLIPAPGEVVPGEFDGLEFEWPAWYTAPKPLDVLVYKQPIVSAVASPDPRQAMRLHKFVDFNSHQAMGSNLAAGATVTVFDWFDYLSASAGVAGPDDVTARGQGASWLSAEGAFLPLVAASGTAEVTVYAYGALNQTPGSRFPWYRTALASAASFPDTTWTHYWSPILGSGNLVAFPPNGCYVRLKNTGGAAIQWESRLFTRSAQ